MTLEAFADTIIPGAKRSPDDRAIAGAAEGGGAVAAGAIEVLEMPAPGLSGGLSDYARTLNGHAQTYAADNALVLDESIPPFVALPFEHRTALVDHLTTPGHPEKDVWFLLALFCTMAYDTAPHLHTGAAIADGHPGLTAMGFAAPDSDGLWRFPDFSYGRPLADLHPETTATGNMP